VVVWRRREGCVYDVSCWWLAIALGRCDGCGVGEGEGGGWCDWVCEVYVCCVVSVVCRKSMHQLAERANPYFIPQTISTRHLHHCYLHR